MQLWIIAYQHHPISEYETDEADIFCTHIVQTNTCSYERIYIWAYNLYVCTDDFLWTTRSYKGLWANVNNHTYIETHQQLQPQCHPLAICPSIFPSSILENRKTPSVHIHICATLVNVRANLWVCYGLNNTSSYCSVQK